MSKYRKSLSLLILFWGILIFFLADHLWASITIETPSMPIHQGQSISLKVEIKDIEPIKGELFYRPSGISYYQKLPLELKKDKHGVITLPSTAVVAPGIEYYIQVVDASGKVVTSPSINAPRNPHSMKVLESRLQSGLKLVSPDTTVPFLGETLSVVLESESSDTRLTRENITIILDNTDISDLATFSDNRMTFSTNLIPKTGQHTIFVEVTEPTGTTRKESWTFKIGGEEKKTREVYARGGLSFNYGRQIKISSGSTGDSLSGNLNLEFGAKGKDWEVTWNGINIQYNRDNPYEKFTLTSGFYFTLRKGEQFLEYGDITIKETPLTAPSFARRGIQAKLKGYGTELHLFDVSTETVSGWNSGIGGGGKQVYGISMKRSLLSDGGLPVHLVYITGENKAVSGYNTAGTQNPSKGDIVGLALSHTIYKIKVDAEIAGSQYDTNTNDNVESKNDIAGTANLATTIGKFDTGLNYYYYGTDFASIANPNFTSDREGFSGNVGTSFGASNISLSGNRSRDNVEGNSNRPVVYSTSGTVSYGLALAPWPSVNLSYSHSLQDSQKEPPGTQQVKNTNDTIIASLSKSGEKWNANLSGNYGRLDDDISNLDSITRGIQLSGGYTPFKGLSLSPSASLTESKSSGVLKNTRIASLTASVPLWSPYADTNLQVSYSLNSASDGSQDSKTLNGSWRLSVNLHEFIKNWINYGQEMLAISANYSKTNDDITPSNSREDYSIFLSINFYAPINWSLGF